MEVALATIFCKQVSKAGARIRRLELNCDAIVESEARIEGHDNSFFAFTGRKSIAGNYVNE